MLPIPDTLLLINDILMWENLTIEQQVRFVRWADAKINAENVPGWATWTLAEAQSWYDTNIGTPLQTDIPTSVTLSNIRPILVAVLNTMRAMGTMLWALARMIIAFRDDRWP